MWLCKAIPLVAILLIALYSAPYSRLSYAQTTFPPPIFLQLREIPSYSVIIPFTNLGNSQFHPSDIAIPVGMTVIWFNDDDGEHTVTTVQNSSSSAPEILDDILDLELVPTHVSNVTRGFTTWGPDFIGEEGYRTTGTFHIMGPVLVTNQPYSIMVSIVGSDNNLFTNPPVDTFDLPLQQNVT